MLRAEATLAAANLVYLLLMAGGAVVLPASAYGAFGERHPAAALRRPRRRRCGRRSGRATSDWGSLLVLVVWAGGRGRPDGEDVQVGVSPRSSATRRRAWLRRLGWATLVANIGIVLTGGAVRLTGSGLGCPTWPRCTDESFTPHGALDFHSAIEFGNRTLTFVLTAIAVATFVSAWQSGRARPAPAGAAGSASSVPAQALLGGITVLTDLNPWVVSFHLLFSMGIISLAVLYLRRIDHPALGGRAASARDHARRSPGRRTPRPGWCSPSAPS